MSKSDNRDMIVAAKAGADQMHAVYRHVWMPLFVDITADLDGKGLRPELVDGIVLDLHRKMIGITTMDPT